VDTSTRCGRQGDLIGQHNILLRGIRAVRSTAPLPWTTISTIVARAYVGNIAACPIDASAARSFSIC